MGKENKAEAVEAEGEAALGVAGVSLKLPVKDACLVIAVAALVGTLALGSLSFGRLPFFNGFAYADHVMTLGDHLKNLQRSLILGQIAGASRAFCAAQKARDSSAAQLADEQLGDLLVEYRLATGIPYDRRPCP